MKKTLTLIILVLFALTLIACSSDPTPGSCWADTEILVYSVSDNDEAIGELTSVIKRNLSLDDKTINGKVYNNATSKISISYNFGETTLEVESLLDDFAPLATYKKKVSPQDSYELNSYYEGKYYHYTLSKDEDDYVGKLKIKSPYIDNDLLYTYIRTYSLTHQSQRLGIPSALSHKVNILSVQTVGTKTLNVPLPEGAENIECHKIAISRTSTPIGESIYVYYTPDEEKYTISGSLNSVYSSSKIPVRIEENNITYNLKTITII